MLQSEISIEKAIAGLELSPRLSVVPLQRFLPINKENGNPCFHV